MVLRRTAGPVPRARCLLLAAVQAHTSAASPRTTPCPPPPSLPCPLPFPVRATSTQRLIPPPPAPSLPQDSLQRWRLQELLTPEPKIPEAIRGRAKGWRLGDAPNLPPAKCYSQLLGFPAQTSTCGLSQLGDVPLQHSSPVFAPVL